MKLVYKLGEPTNIAKCDEIVASCIIQSVGKIKNYISSTFHQRFINDVYNIIESSYERLLFKK